MLSRHFSFTITKSKRFVCSSIRRSFQHTRIPFFNQLSFYASVPVQQKLPKNSLKTDVQKDDKMIEDPKHRNVKNLQSSENKIKSSSDKQKTPKNKEEKRTIQRKTENKKSSLKERSKTDSLQQPEVEKNDQLSHKKTLQQSKKKNTVPPSQQKGKTLPTVTTATTDPSEQTQNLKSKRKIADEKDFDFLAPLEETNRSFMDTNPETFQNHWQNVEYFSRTYLGLTFNNWELFQRALTHKSYINVPILHNESLAILGKEILSFYLLDYFVSMGKDFNEAIRQRNFLFRRSLFAEFAKKLLLHEVLRVNMKLPEPEETTTEQQIQEQKEEFKQRILCHTFYAVVAAVTLDLGYEEATKLMREYIRFSTELIIKRTLNADDEENNKSSS